MATFTLNVQNGIHAEIKGGNKSGIAYTPIILDPLTNSYSRMGKLTKYSLSISNVRGLEDPRILQNGKNSRFIAGGNGSCHVNLIIEDEHGNTATDSITITIL